MDDLRLFLHIVAEGSITAGARRMHLSLPSAGARVRSLEHHAGVALLIRGRRGGCAPPRRGRRRPATHGMCSPRRRASKAP
ncbi:LysR family transcriptional regulator [Streptomyces antimycoticus]